MLTSTSQRVPPVEPSPPAEKKPETWRRYMLKMQAWFAGELLRSLYGITLHAPDMYPLPKMIASYHSEQTGSAPFPSDQMDSLIRYLDTQALYYTPLRKTLFTLHTDHPEITSVLWARHIDLATIKEISSTHNISERTVKYRLAYGNGRIFSMFAQHTLLHRAGVRIIAKTSSSLIKDLTKLMQQADPASDTSLDVISLSGSEESTYIE